jgi:hypothetical protein
MEAFRFSEFKGSARKPTPRGEWVSDSGSLYPTLDVANTVDVLADNIRSKVATMTGFKEQATQVPHLMRLFRLNGGSGPTIPYDQFITTLAKMNVSTAPGLAQHCWKELCSETTHNLFALSNSRHPSS